jgi:hypothetical protein
VLNVIHYKNVVTLDMKSEKTFSVRYFILIIFHEYETTPLLEYGVFLENGLLSLSNIVWLEHGFAFLKNSDFHIYVQYSL